MCNGNAPHTQFRIFIRFSFIPFEISMLFGILLLFNRVSASSNDYVNVLVVSYSVAGFDCCSIKS